MSRQENQSFMPWPIAAEENDTEEGDAGVSPGSGPDSGGWAPAPIETDGGRNESAARTPRSASSRKKVALSAVVKKTWIVLVIAVVVTVAGFSVNRLRGVFGAHDSKTTSNGLAEDIKPFNPKHVLYEVYGPPGTVANINYLDIDAQPRRVNNVPLPWTLSATTTLSSVSVNIVAQGDSDRIGCRITVNGVVKDERSVNEVNAQTFCIVKSA